MLTTEMQAAGLCNQLSQGLKVCHYTRGIPGGEILRH
jgi:hypothetical protein